jgi:hypothetical protein
MPANKIEIVITPAPVVNLQPWHARISGFKPGQDQIVLGNGFDDGNWMFHAYYTANENGVVEVDPPVFDLENRVPMPADFIFNVLQMLGARGNSKVLATMPYQVVA